MNLNSGVQAMAYFSGTYLAIFFGMISPNIIITRVMTTDDTAMPFPPRILVKSTVAKDAETTLTMVFPIRIVVSSFEKSSVNSKVLAALMFPELARAFSLILFSEEKAVSEALKKL